MPIPSSHAFAEKVALVTEGTGPVGRAVAMQLALYGCFVVLVVDGPTDEERQAIDELRSLGTLAHYFEADLKVRQGAYDLIREVDGLYGRLDLLVNCLKTPVHSAFHEITEKGFEESIDSVFKSKLFLILEAMRLMDSRPKPKIVNVVSANGKTPGVIDIAHSAANSAVLSMTRSLSETLPGHYRVNAVAVEGKTDGSGGNEVLDPELFRRSGGIQPDDVARTVLYLLSSESIGLNGQVLTVG